LFTGLFIVILWIVFYSTIASVEFFSDVRNNAGLPSNVRISCISPVIAPVSDTTVSDTTHLPYHFNDEEEYPVSNMTIVQSPLYLHSPSNLTSTVDYDPVTNQYVFSQKIGKINYRYPAAMSYDEYRQFEFDNALRKYWHQKYGGESFEKQQSVIPQLYVGGDVFDRIFGSNVINIQPQGSAELIFGVNISKTANPSLPIKLQRTVTFDFQEKIMMNVTGKIGDKMELQANYNTESTFEFENKMNLRYEGKEDEIIQVVEAGDVTLPLSGSLITGSQSLFGLKTELQFGKLRVTSVLSQQRGEPQVIEVQGGAQLNNFSVTCDNYEANKHFFLSQYFREHYDKALEGLPVINSGITINKIEVWVTNKSGNFQESRNIIAFLDLGEGHVSHDGLYGNTNIFNEQIAVANITAGEYPHNDQNDLYQKMTTTYSAIRNINQVTSVLGGADFVSHNFLSGQDYEKVENARKLSPTEFTLNAKLGYISLSSALNADEVLAVAFEYTVHGKTYRVGEFSQDGPASPNALFLKMIKGTYLSPKIIVQTTVKKSPTWELMMKNIYSIGAYQVNPDGFLLNVMYQYDKTGTAINYIPEGPKPDEGGINGKILIQVLNLDNLNSQLDPSPDGTFDFVAGVTINPTNGRVIFPVLQPFGKYLFDKITGGNPAYNDIANKYVFQELYDSTQTWARSISEKNKFFLEGTYQSASSSEINLNATNIPQGSVKVTVGGNQLIEGQDYTVDYNLGRVKIINQGLLESGAQVKISLESNSLFNIQTKTLIGTHLDYKFNSDFHIGGTILNLTERPLTSKVNIGDEPISNTIWGLDGSYRTDAPYITNLIDKLPFLDTKESSNITVNAEFAHLIPGHSRVLKKSGVSYIDDFEGTTTHIELRQPSSWVLSSTPQLQPDLFPEGQLNNNLAYGFNRAKFAWYYIDPTSFLRNTSLTPPNINADAQSSHFVREVFEKEIFPNKETLQGIPTTIQTLSLAFYPDEKGPYNYDVDPSQYSAGIRKDGSGRLADPQSRWAGVMRRIETNDFEAANYEFIEFWLLDPFCEDKDSSNTGGKLYFNLGNVSEDILKDSRKSFENGLPTSATDTLNIDTTVWGRVPLVQSLVDAFDNNPDSRKYQDIGLDGLNDEQENTFFSSYVAKIDSLHNAGELSDSAYNVLYTDPSMDDFHYYLGGDYDALQLGILDRYKKYNGLEGNSPVGQGGETYIAQSSIAPDVEDINHDKTLSEGESYYQYEVPITYENFLHDKKYITDEIEVAVTFKNGQQSHVKWYQFKIPIYEPDKVMGSISDFKSIRFMRMFLKGFSQDVVLRFATLDLVRGEWRKYILSLKEGGEYTPSPQPENAAFDVTSVNIEENGSRSPVNYVLPPGIDREIDPTNPQMGQLNEQSMLMKVINLADGDARAAYKNVTMDVRTYKRMQMEVHAEEIAGYPLNDNDLSVFIRLGADYRQNFYEYEVPLKLTPPGLYNNNNNSDRETVWPSKNRIDLYFDLLTRVKQLRNKIMEDTTNQDITLTSHFSRSLDQNGNIIDDEIIGSDTLRRITVCGNPNLSNIRTIMIGIRNPNNTDNDDPKSGIVWVNELRLTDFDERGGWALNARVVTKLADLGMLTLSGSTSKPGFGSIEKKVSERSKEEVYQYDISSNLELGKFFPQKAGIKIPMYVGFSQTIKNPQYNPLDPDIPFEEALNSAKNKREQDSIKHIAQDFSQRKSINFTNVQINRGMKEKPSLLDISNLSLSYAYSEIYTRNINTVYNIIRNYHGALAYNFNTQSKNVMPFNKIKFLKPKSLSLIRDINFYYIPQQISLRTEIERNYQETQLRNISNPDVVIYPTYKKDFLWNRMYDLRYDLSRGLKLDFSATNNARIDEPDGKVDRHDKESYQHWKDSVLTNIANFGRTTQYHHMFNLNWNTPLNKLPLLDWTSLSARYNCTYDWTAGPLERDTTGKLYNRLGNTIKNTNTFQLNGQITLTTIYNKIAFLKKLNQPSQQKGPKGPKGAKDVKGKNGKAAAGKEGEEQDQGKYEHVTYEKTNMEFKANTPRIIVHNLQTTDVQVSAFDSTGQKIIGQQKIIDENRVSYTFDKDYKKVKIIVSGRRKLREDYWMIVLKHTLKAIMGIKNISVTYSQTNGTLLPGYMPRTRLFGLNRDNNGILAPGIPFVLGFQDKKFAEKAGDNGWLTLDSTLNSPYIMNASETWNFRSTIEPAEGLRIELNAQRTLSENRNEFYFPDSNGKFRANSSTITGNFTMSFLSWSTAFEKIEDKTYWTNAFRNMLNYRITIANRLRDDRLSYDNQYSGATVDSTGFPDGYSPTSPQVLIPAFMAAYGGLSPAKVALESFPSILHILPNWRITFDGLTKIDWFKKYFKTISVNHTYRCTYNIGNYATSLLYIPDEDGISRVRDVLDVNYLPKYEINSVSISEQFSPLLDFDMTWNNSLTTKVEFKKSRNLTLTMSNNQVTEVRSDEYVIGAGYRIKDLQFTLKVGGKSRQLKSDLNLKADFSIRSNMTVMHQILENQTPVVTTGPYLNLNNNRNQLTSGQRMYAIKISADYTLSDRFNLKFFIDTSITKPLIALSFPTTNTNIGFSIRFTLTN
jgi:cell surface protein SprA